MDLFCSQSKPLKKPNLFIMEQSNAPVAARPTFLTVLCILTWIGCAISLVTNALAMMAMGAVSAVKDAVVENAEVLQDSLGVTMADGAEAKMDVANAAADSAIAAGSTVFLIGIIGAVLALIGSVMMWKLKKMGFYVYVVAELAPVIAMAVLLGGTAFSGATAMASMILPVAFVVMYGLNLKHMK